DAKSILDALVRGGGQPQTGPQRDDLGGISDLLKQLAGADQGPRAAEPSEAPSMGRASRGDDDREPEERAPQRRASTPRDEDAASGRDTKGGGLDDLLRSVLGGQGG